jgi:hypothetical protein
MSSGHGIAKTFCVAITSIRLEVSATSQGREEHWRSQWHPSAATAAALFHLRDQLAGQRVVGVLSGGNLDLRELRKILAAE